MFAVFPAAKSIATALSLTLAIGTALPVGVAHSHDRHNAAAHFGPGTNINKKRHRAFHNQYGRGVRGERTFRQVTADRRAARAAKKRRKSDRKDLIAAGIIGLAVGAIIASESSKRRNQPSYSYQEPQRHSYNGDSYYQPYEPNRYDNSYYGEPIPLNEYEQRNSYNNYGGNSGGPNVITYNDPSSYEPWSPEWHRWCSENYRSFNPSRGTFRGYDGLDHFCVPK